MIKTTKKIPNIITHDESFHADDVFAVATLKIFTDGKFRLQRTRKPDIIKKADFVLDVGGVYDGKTRFDHHQIGGAGQRENGIPFASFGLVWKKFGIKICGGRKVADHLDKELVQFIDAQDNGVNTFKATKDFLPYTISSLISSFNPTWQEGRKKQDYSRSFKKAVNLAEEIILREISRAKSKIEAEKFIKQAYQKAQDKKIIILNKNYPWQESILSFSEPLFVIYPKGGFWRVSAVRKNNSSFVLRKPFPKSWSGKTGESLIKSSGVEGATFCHRNLFLTVAMSKEGAVELAQKAIKK